MKSGDEDGGRPGAKQGPARIPCETLEVITEMKENETIKPTQGLKQYPQTRKEKKVCGESAIIIGSNIRRLLEMCGMSQAELARRIYVSPQTLSVYIHGWVMPKADLIADMAKAMECTCDEILFPPEPAASTDEDGESGEEEEKLDTKTRRGALMKLRHEIDDLLDE